MTNEDQQAEVEIPKGQKFFDSIFWLLVISLLTSAIIYNAWGLIELLRTPTLP